MTDTIATLYPDTLVSTSRPISGERDYVTIRVDGRHTIFVPEDADLSAP